jgi:mannose/fructose/N-acetylgalactosamine-specific phosphotransferase system component IIB
MKQLEIVYDRIGHGQIKNWKSTYKNKKVFVVNDRIGHKSLCMLLNNRMISYKMNSDIPYDIFLPDDKIYLLTDDEYKMLLMIL